MQDEISAVNTACYRVAVLSSVCFCVMLVMVFFCFGQEHSRYLKPAERLVAGFAASCLTTSLVLRMISQLCIGLRHSSSGEEAQSKSGRTSGVTLLSHTTNLIAAVTSWFFCLAKVPTLIDPVTLCRVHLLRWCEWAVLAFVMTFMTEVADRSSPWFIFTHTHTSASCSNSSGAPLSLLKTRALFLFFFFFSRWSYRVKYVKIHTRSATRLATMQALSTVCGIFLPLCPGAISWGCVMLCVRRRQNARQHGIRGSVSSVLENSTTLSLEVYKFSTNSREREREREELY